MRRKQCQVTDPEAITEILRRCTVGRLATIGIDGYPYITPVNYAFWGGSVYFHCARKGEKTDNILRDPKVCFEVDIPLAYLDTHFEPTKPACQVHQFYHSVIIRGKAEIVEDLQEKVGALNALMASHEKIEGYSAITKDTEAVASCSVVAVRVESLSAKSDLAQKKDDATRQRIADYLEQRNLPGDGEAARRIRPGMTK
ncbi:pyridoxamine 5'-phosphate oxidase family protein [Desulfopila aestuarii]|uniref:Nitroimidazol reductase NimA, pyridoxamine 5'-phosphate oxidase superfamily n=1 Tax=Desulfopila aestuarii DSM 18488 TaxID=1121416 RepID=A0A1M7Y800_9BACT|nr:pyridoxamine 5'-phosphate oxidase family protein [Desulfopila aestuarii]SHO48747.1 Nitroimidazol reductase NimA, pyridoxamine 5'-phosphate oxidase superfamily [Desulfopila aestuarii DSM 18488]